MNRILSLIFCMILLFCAVSYSADLTVAWDANTEEDLAGYKILHGQSSRMTTSYGFMQKWCDEHEPGRETCLEEWQEICENTEDQACHPMLFEYETVVDVGNVTEYTLTGLNPAKTYFLSAIAYNDKGNESAYSIELIHVFVLEAVKNFRKK